jgi:chromosome partitioning protein
MGRVIAIANQKGGVGKTTTVINLAAALTENGNRLLLVDMDPQGALSTGLGVRLSSDSDNMYQVLMAGIPLGNIIVNTDANLDLAPANLDLAGAEVELIKGPGLWQFTLYDRLEAVVPYYDFILIDCPPSLGVLTYNSLVAANEVIIPVECQYFAWQGMRLLFETIANVRHPRLNPNLKIAGILPTMYEGRTRHCQEVLEELHKNYDKMLFKTVIRRTIKMADATVAAQTILTFNKSSDIAKAYRKLALEVQDVEAGLSNPAGTKRPALQRR